MANSKAGDFPRRTTYLAPSQSSRVLQALLSPFQANGSTVEYDGPTATARTRGVLASYLDPASWPLETDACPCQGRLSDLPEQFPCRLDPSELQLLSGPFHSPAGNETIEVLIGPGDKVEFSTLVPELATAARHRQSLQPPVMRHCAPKQRLCVGTLRDLFGCLGPRALCPPDSLSLNGMASGLRHFPGLQQTVHGSQVTQSGTGCSDKEAC
ncbi:hypothetical protein NA56DRAFT_709682 [Hyaloscypha hepaticicola]|uniref:Uncharacterized protein n=1 Tax=Hyaloscypha hepaticicola TaxID=2082293 RepID=A0A2J6PND2_9HELO|nr:hypothetical protein NA56DRAFT_709682 [Hyaloscypha hepaticicola]